MFKYLKQSDEMIAEQLLTDCKGYLSQQKIVQVSKPATLYFDESHRIAIKDYHWRGFTFFLKHCFRKSRAENAYQAALMLQKLGFKTPTPRILIVKRFCGLWYKTVLAYDFISGKMLHDYLRETNDLNMLDKAVDIILKLHKNRITHGDMKATNFIVHEGDIYLIDLDILKKRSTLFEKCRKKDVKRFLKNWRHDEALMNHPALARLKTT